MKILAAIPIQMLEDAYERSVAPGKLFTVKEMRDRAQQEMKRTGKTAEELLMSSLDVVAYTPRQRTLAASDQGPGGYTLAQCWQLWNEINDVCFDNDLRPFQDIYLEPNLNHLIAHLQPVDLGVGADGIMGYCDIDPVTEQEVLLLRDDLQLKELVAVVAHEMVHQHLSQTEGYEAMCKIGHGAKFMGYADRIKRYYNTTLLGAEYNL